VEAPQKPPRVHRNLPLLGPLNLTSKAFCTGKKLFQGASRGKWAFQPSRIARVSKNTNGLLAGNARGVSSGVGVLTQNVRQMPLVSNIVRKGQYRLQARGQVASSTVEIPEFTPAGALHVGGPEAELDKDRNHQDHIIA
jgi:hypothetical protein